MIDKVIHINFKLNEIGFESVNDILRYSKTISLKLFLFLDKWFDESDHIILKTSGSTGKPKSLMVKKEYMINSARATGIHFDLKPKTTALLCLPLEYIAGKMMVIRSMVLGWHLDIVEPTSKPLNHVMKNYDFSAMVPVQLYNSLDKIEKIKTLIVGGGKVNNDIKSRIWDLSTKMYATYGMTETVSHIAVNSLNKASGSAIENDYYQCLPNVILSKDDRDCLVIDAPRVTEKAIVTNDIVDLFSDTKFRWLGRYDHIINSGGIKLIPEQIEKKIQSIIKNKFFISSVDDDILGDKVILIIEGDYSKTESERFMNRISKIKSIRKYEIPKEIFFVKKFYITETNKIIRNKTKDQVI